MSNPANPFPGMNPYLEGYWADVHHTLITYAREQLRSQLPSELRARVEERVYLEGPDGQQRSIYPDVHVHERPIEQPNAGGTATAIAVAEPLSIELQDEIITEGFIEIRDARSGNRVVTVIEVLSLANKVRGAGQNLYTQKQNELIAGKVSLVEIDLLRRGEHVLAVPDVLIPLTHRTPYRVCVRRGWRPLRVEYYRIPLAERLPTIRIPLRESDRDIYLDLQALVQRCCEAGNYSEDIDYTRDPDPPLSHADLKWLHEHLRGLGKRT